MGKEICPKTKKKHVQGYVKFRNQKYLAEILNKIGYEFPKKHGRWEKAKGTMEENVNYCTKEMSFKTNIELPPRLKAMMRYSEVTWKPWQVEVTDICKTEPDGRTIHWYWEEEGNMGKSFLAKFLVIKYDAIVASGKASDIFNQVMTWMLKHKNMKSPKVVILDVPRCVSGFVSYQALEKLCDGLLYSGKYEGGLCIFEPPHIIVFANEEPDTDKMSEDRWHIVEVKKE